MIPILMPIFLFAATIYSLAAAIFIHTSNFESFLLFRLGPGLIGILGLFILAGMYL